MPKLTTPTNYLKNITKSVIYAAVDVTKGYAEETIDFAESNKEVFIQTYAALKNPRAAVKRSLSAIQNSKAFQALDYGVRNLSEDLLSGKFYNKERMERDAGKFTIGGTDDWDDLSDFMDDQDQSTISSKEPNSEITAGDIKIVDSIEGSNSALAASTTKAVVVSTDMIVKNNRSNMSMIYTQNERLFGRINDNMSIMHHTMGSIQTILTQSLGNLDKNTSTFFTESIKYQKEDNAILKEMLEMQRNVYKSAETKEQESSGKKKSKIRFSDIAMNGMPDLQKYGENIKKNIQNQMSTLGLPSFGEDSNFLAEIMVSPLQYVTEYVVGGLIPITLKESMKELNDSLTGVFGTLMGRLANADDGPLSFIAKILGVNNGINRRVDASKYEKGPIPFDGITRKAIIDVIPSHLRKIEAAVTRQTERIYDYNAGRWTDAISAKKEYENIRKNAIRSGTSNMVSNMDNEMKMILANATGSEKTDLKKAFEEFREYMYDNRGIFDHRKSASQNNINYSNYPNLSKHYSKIVTAYQKHAQRYDMKGNQVTDYSKYLTPARDIMLARDNEEKQYRMLEETNNAIKVLVSEGANTFNKVGGKLHYSNDKAKSYWEAANPYKQLKDNKGNSIFDYLYKITGELIQIRSTGIPGVGVNNGSNDQDHRLTPTEIEAAIRKENYRDPVSDLNRRNTAPATEKDLEKALERIASGEALDLRDFDENEQKALAAYGKAVMVHNTDKYSQNIKNQMEDNFIANFMGKNVYKYNVMTLNDIKEINKKANEQNVSTDEVNTNDKEEGKFIKRIKDAVSKYGNIPSAVIGGSVEAFNKVLYSADKAIYEMMYKTELKNTEDKNKYEGFMDFLVGKTEDTFKSLKDGIAKHLIDPIKERLGIDDEWQDRFKDSLSGGFMAIANEFINANKSVYGPLYDKVKVKTQTAQAKKNMAEKGWQKGLTKTGEIGWIKKNDALATKEVRDVRNTTLADQSKAYLDRNYRKYFSMTENELAEIAIANGTNPEAIDNMRRHSVGDTGEYNNDVFKNNLIKNILRHERSLHAKGTFSSPFMGKTMLSKGELLFGVGKDGAPSLSNGIKEVKETGAYDLPFPTHILNPKSDMAKQQDLGKEKLKAKQLGLDIAKNAPGTLKISSDHDITAEEFLKQAKTYSAEGAAGGVLGGALGLLLPGGPILGAALGAGVNIIRSSETLKDKLLGGLDKDGNRKGGIIPKTIQDTVKKYLPDMTKYGLAGVIPGLLTPLGPIGGLLVGGAIGYLKNNERFTNKYFGENGKLTIGTKEKEILDKLIPGAIKGGIAGAGVGLVLGGPFGLIGNALIGSAVGMATTTDDWKDAILGTDINGIREGGLVGVFKDAFKPIIEGLSNVKSKIEEVIEDSIINPLQRFIKPAIHAIPKMLGAVPRLFVDWLDKRTEKIRETIGTKIRKFISPLAGLGKKLLSPITSIATLPVKAIGGLVGRAGDRARAYNIRHGDMVDMTQREAVEWMRSAGREHEISDELKFTSSLTDAEKTRGLANSLNQLLDTRQSAKNNFNKQVKSLNDILINYEDSEGHRLSNMQISKVLEAAKDGNLSAVGEILRNYKLQGSRNGLTEAEFNSLMEENGLKKAISGVKEAEYRKNHILDGDEAINNKKEELIRDFKEAGLDINLDDLTDVKNRKKINNLAKLLSDQAIHLEANPEEKEKSSELQSEANTHLDAIQEATNTIVKLMAARVTGNPEDIKEAMDSVKKDLDVGQKYTNQKYEDTANKKIAKAGFDPEEVTKEAFDTLTAKGTSAKNVSIDSLNAIGKAGAKNTKKIAKINNKVEKQLDSAAIEELYKLNDEESKRVIDRLNNREVSNVIINGGYPVDKDTIHFLAKPITGTFKTFVGKCKFINKGQCWSEFKSLEEIAETGLDKFADLRDKYDISYETFTSIFNKSKSLLKEELVSTGKFGAKATGFVASAPFKAVGKVNKVVNNLTHNIHDNEYYANRIRPDDDTNTNEEEPVAQNGIGTFLLGGLSKLAGGVVGGAKKVLGGIKNKAKSALISHLPFGNSEAPDKELGATSGSVEKEMSDDGKTTVMTEDGPAVIKNGTDGSPEYDTTDPKTKLLLKAKEVKAKAAEKLQTAQQKMSEKFNQMFDEAEDANKSGSKLGSLLGLLFGGALLLKSGVLGKIFDTVVKPVWTNHIYPWITDKALPWVGDKLKSVGNWVLNTALPAVGNLIGKGINLLIKALPTIITGAIKGVKNIVGGVLDGITGNITNVGASTTTDTKTSKEAVFKDSNGKTVTLEEAIQNSANDPDYKFYNHQGAAGTVNEDGTATFKDESMTGSSYVKSMVSPATHAFVQGGRHIGGVRLANSAFKGLAKSKGKGLFGLAKRGVGYTGQAIAAPIEAAGKAGYKFWDTVNNAAVNRVSKALGDEVIEGSSEAALKNMAKKFGDNKIVNFIKNADESIDYGLNLLANKNNRNIAKAASKAKKPTILGQLVEYGKDKLKTNAKNTASNIIEGAKTAATKNPKELVKGLFKSGKDKLKTSAKSAASNVIEGIETAAAKNPDGLASRISNMTKNAGDNIIGGAKNAADNIISSAKNATDDIIKGAKKTAGGLFERGKDKLKTNAKNAASNVIKGAEEAAAKNPKGLAGRILNRTKNAGESKGLAKLLDALKQGLDKIFGDGKIAKKLTQAAELLHINKIGKWITKLRSSIDNIFDDILRKAAKKFGSETVKKAASKLNVIVAVLMVVIDFLVGCDQAEKILGVSETSIIEELVAGFINALCNLLILPSLWPGPEKLAQLIIKLFSKDLTKRQEEAAKEAEEYNKENGTTLTVEEYLSRNKSVTGKIGGKISDAFSNATKSISSGWKSFTKSVKSIKSNSIISRLFGKGSNDKKEYPINNPVVNAYSFGKGKTVGLGALGYDQSPNAILNSVSYSKQTPSTINTSSSNVSANTTTQESTTTSTTEENKSDTTTSTGENNKETNTTTSTTEENKSNTDNKTSGTGPFKYIKSPNTMFGKGYSKQIDPSIANIPYNISADSTKQTIGDSACGPAAAVNVIESFGRGGNAVAKAADFALKGGYKEVDGGTKPGFFQDYFAQYGYGSQISHNTKTLESNINNGYPTVLMGRDARGTTSLTPFGKNPHYVTVTGTDGKGNSIVQDPESPHQNQLYPTKKLLNKSSLGISAFGRGRGKGYNNYINTVSKYGLGRGKYGKPRYGRGAVQFNQTTDQVWAFLTSIAGLSENAAAGIMGCWQCESSINPARVEGDYTSEGKKRGVENILSSRSEMDSWCQWLFAHTNGIHPEKYRVGEHYYCGVGLAQWTAGRTKSLFDYAESNGKNVFDLDTQLNFCKSEFDGSYAGVKSAGNSASDLRSATVAMLEGYEAGKGWASRNPTKFNDRYTAAQEIFSHYTGKQIEYTGEALSGASTVSGGAEEEQSSESPMAGLIGQLASAVTESKAGKIMSTLLGGTSSSSSSSTTTGGDSSSSGGNTTLAGPMAQKFVQAALGEEGYAESGNNNTKYGEWFGMNNVPWCAEFVSWAADQAGIPTSIVPKTAAAWNGMRPFFRGKNAVVDSTQAQMGDVFTTTGHSHTGIVVDYSNGEVHTIEGNSGDKVAKRTHAPSELEVYRPEWTDGGEATSTTSIDTSGFESLEDSQKVNNYANTRGSNGIKPLSSYGVFRDTIHGKGVDANSLKAPVRRGVQSKGGYYTIEELGMDKEISKQQKLAKRKFNYGKGSSNNESYYLGTGTLDDTKFNELIKWVITIANNTDQLNTIIKILNDKLGINISATDVANAQGIKTNTQHVVNKVKLSQSGRSKFSQFQDQLENSSIQSVVQAMNAIAAE